MNDPISDLIADVAAGAGIRESVYAPDVEFDATTPGWRFQRHGANAARGTLAGWFADPGTFEELTRLPVPGGEFVSWTLNWMEDGDLHTTHQAHLLQVDNGRITNHQAWCGGRWPSERVAEMKGG